MENLPRVGRPRKLSNRDENWIMRAVKSNKYRTLNDITLDFNEGKHRTELSINIQSRYFSKNRDINEKLCENVCIGCEVNRKSD